MISGKQLQQVLNYSFTSGANFIAPTASLVALPSVYTETGVPSSVDLSGTIILNDAASVTWVLLNNSNIMIGSGSGTSPLVTLTGLSIPNTLGAHNFTLNVTYLDGNGISQTFSTITTIFVTATALYGQLNNPTQDILVPGDLIPYEPLLTSTGQNTLINLFAVNAVDTGRIVIVVPDSYGSVLAIEDNTSSNITTQFHIVADIPGSRKMYITNLALTPGTYYFKLIF